MTIIAAILVLVVGGAGQDLQLSYVSPIDQSRQPYRLYVPAGHDRQRSAPLVVALHGTMGDQNTFFDNPKYLQPSIKDAADRLGMLVVCPYGRGAREYRGIGEQDVFAVIEEVAKSYVIDRDRVYLLGHSMGGTGAAYLALHHPDAFAAVAPLAAAYGWPAFAVNARHVPFWWIAGANDKAHFRFGSGLGIDAMRAAGVEVRSDNLPGEDHYGTVKNLDRVLEWMSRRRLERHPQEFMFVVDTPLHGSAYGVRVDALEHPGRMGKVQASAESAKVKLSCENLAIISLSADLFEGKNDWEVDIDNAIVFRGKVHPREELRLEKQRGHWTAKIDSARERSPTAYRFTPVGEAPRQLDMSGTEATLANWMTDAMRDATGADIALMNRQYYRGTPIKPGPVDMVDLLHAMPIVDANLIVVRLTGKDLLEILDDNVPDPKKDKHYAKDGPDANRLIQLSGARYTFDRTQPPGKRIVASNLDPARTYSVVLEGYVVYWETMLLAGRFGTLKNEPTEIPFSTALYSYAKRQGQIVARVEGRVVERDGSPVTAQDGARQP